MISIVRRHCVIAITATLVALTAPASALDLDQARAQGLVGERPDGLIGVVDANAAEVRTLVDSVNAARMAEYRGIAQKNGTPLEAVQAVAGDKLVQRAKGSNWYVMDASGRWAR